MPDNGEKIAALNRQQYLVLSLAPGHHVLQLKQERPPKGSPKHQVDLDVRLGATYYAAGGDTPDLHNFVWTFTEVSKDDADRLLAQMKPVMKGDGFRQVRSRAARNEPGRGRSRCRETGAQGLCRASPTTFSVRGIITLYLSVVHCP